jgi:uncharacterized protein YbjQ (UPF0145 family)
MLVTTTLNVEGERVVRYLGIVRGVTVRSPTIAQGLLGKLANIIGGRIAAYTRMCEEARRQAFASMLLEAEGLGATAVIGVRYDASALEQSATEVLCYGTAVVTQDLSTPPV